MSTTHTITGAIVGVGAARRLSAVRWGVAGRVVWAWLLTIPRLRHVVRGVAPREGPLDEGPACDVLPPRAVVCFLLLPLAADDFRWITLGVASTYLVLSLASYLDFRGRR